MADVEDFRSASEEEEESEDEHAYESEASTDPVADAGDQLDVDVARCCARYGDAAAERSTTKGSRTLIVTLKIDPTRSQASAETRQAWGLTAPLAAKLVRSSCNNNDNLQGVAIAPSTGKLQYYYRKQFIELKREILLQLGTLREKKIALAIMLADACSFRVGNRKNKNPGGITTLKKTH